MPNASPWCGSTAGRREPAVPHAAAPPWSGADVTTRNLIGNATAARPARGALTTSLVRPENWRGPHHPVDPQGSMRECPVREPCPPKCCYPDMRRSNPTCEASGTTATIWEHQSGGGLAEDGRLNASERPWLRSVIGNRPKVLTGRAKIGMRVGSSTAIIDDGGAMTRRTIGRSLPIRSSTSGNRVSPTRPAAARRRYPDREGGGWRRG